MFHRFLLFFMVMMMAIIMGMNGGGGELAYAQALGETNTSGQAPQQKLPTPGGGSGQGINQSAGKGQSSQILGMALNATMGAYFFSRCDHDSPHMCVLGALSFAQAALMGKAAKQSKKTHMASLAGIATDGYSSDDPSLMEDPNSFLSTHPDLTPEQKAAFKSLKDQGFVLRSDGSVVSPEGKVFSPKDFASQDAMLQAGVPAGALAGLQAAMDKANKEAEAKLKAQDENEANVVAMPLDGGGGGGGRSPSSYDFDQDNSMDEYLKKMRHPLGMSAQQKSDMVAGKAVSHGGDIIGVQVDDIFTMIHRRYQAKRADQEFMEEPSVAVVGAKATRSRPSFVPSSALKGR